MVENPPAVQDLPALARTRVQSGPAPDWIVPCEYNPDFAAKISGPVTHLLIDQQVHAEQHQTYVRTAARLETMQAVHDEAQWRLEFDPRAQSVVLHSIKTRRGSLETDHTSVDRIQFLRREAGLEGCVIDGSITVLLLLEDVSPGDVLEFSYTVTDRPRLLPEYVTYFFSLPAGAEVGKYHFSVRHSRQRSLKWKSSSPNLSPTTAPEGTEVRCCWQGELTTVSEVEALVPAWRLVFPWVQVSDCPDWQTVARAVREAWKETPGDATEKLVEEIKDFSPEPLRRLGRAIELVQDRFRYLSVKTELGGHMPSPPDAVVRRRFGDCKDLAFLLVHLLRALGVQARPVLVNTNWRQFIGDLLPSSGVFNHVVTEFQIENETRWVDATMKFQGGGALHRAIVDFGFGLLIDDATTELTRVPKASLPTGAFELKESYLLDTAGYPSQLGLVVSAKGEEADALRAEFESESIEAIARKRVQMIANRFSRAGRIGQLQFRDSRDTNEFFVAENFEIDGFLKEDRADNSCVFFIQSELAGLGMVAPGMTPRREPFALPFPFNRTHVIEVEFAGLDMEAVPLAQIGNDWFSFSRRTKVMQKYLRVTFSLSTLATAVPADRSVEHCKRVEAVWQESRFYIRLPIGYGRMRRASGLATLPTPSRPGLNPTPAVTAPIPDLKDLASKKAVSVPNTDPDIPATGEKTTLPLSPPSEPMTVAQPPPTQPKEFVPPARPEERSRAYSPAPRRRLGRLGLQSLKITGAAAIAFFFAAICSTSPKTRNAGGLILLVVIGAVLWAVVFAVLGLRECARFGHRRGRSAAITTLVLAALFALLMVPPLINTYPYSRNAAGGKGLANRPDKLEFHELNFEFLLPELPWQQVDARMFGPTAVVGFVWPEQMVMNISVIGSATNSPDRRAHAIELSKKELQSAATPTSYRLLTERETIANGIAWWETESRANLQGRSYYLVHWLYATNGFYYQLALWGPPEIQTEVKREAGRLFPNFYLMAARR
jgi:hypothetical protein